MRALMTALALTLAVPSIARAEQETKTVKQSRLYFNLLFDSKAPPFASARQPLHVEIDDSDAACKGLALAKVTTDAQSKKLKACAVALRDRFPLPIDKTFVEDMKVADFLKLFDKKSQARLRAATKGMSIVQAGIPGDGESMTVFFGLNKEFSIRGIWIQTEAVE